MRQTLILAVLLVAGCSQAESVEYYKTHKAERMAKLDSCVVGPLQMDTSDQGCVNAAKALNDIRVEERTRWRQGGAAGVKAGQAVVDKAVADAMNGAKAKPSGNQ